MLTNIILVVLIAAFATTMIIWWRSGSSSAPATNSLLKHRRKRVVNHVAPKKLPDVSTAHAHEKKLKVEVAYVMPPRFFKFKLITSINSKHKYNKISSVTNMRKPHPLLSKLISNISDAKTLYETVKTDPELVAKIINVSNSPLFALSKPITNVHHAIVFLGIVQVKNIATHFALQKSLDFSDKQQQQAYQQIWATSFLASSIMLIIATAMEFDNAAELSTRCQLSYLGDISTLFSAPKTADIYVNNQSYFERMEFIQTLTKANTAILGGILAKRWNLPSEISVALHNSSLPFTNAFTDKGLSETQIQQILLCYCCCRLAEAIIFDDSTDIVNADELSFEETGKEEFYHMPELLKQYKLNKLTSVFASVNTKSKILETVRLTVEKLH